jgi:formyl-CoA transferase
MMLGDMGADVIKVEPVGVGDDTRGWGPPFAGGESAYFLGVNRNKRSLTLDLAQPEGREILAALIDTADVLVENFKLGTLDRWGFGEVWLAERAPRLIRCSISGYGPTGPRAGQPGYDFILQAESGLMSICGEPGGSPTKYGVAIVDVCTGLLACNVILAAVQARHRTGRGQRVEVSLYETALTMLANVASSYLVAGTGGGRYGNGHPSIVPYTTYPTLDGLVAVAVGNDGQFARFAAAVGHAEWARDERFARNRDRVVHRQLLDGMIADIFRGDTAQAWITKLQAAGVPCGRINSVAEALDDPHTAARRMVETVQHPTVGALRLLGIPFTLTATPATVRHPPPTLGQHTDEILGQELGLSARRIDELRARAVI